MSTTDIPGYKIIRTLGVGGQATVYLAIQKGFDRKVALKVMSPALAADPTFGDRFLREAKIVAKLSHKSIVTVYDVGEHGNFYYLAMEYLPGGDLKSKIAEGVKVKESLAIVAKLGQALNFAHDKGYVHRDVKSENIIFDEDGEPVLTDFGIAKASNSSTQMTQTGKLIGTPEYMSPEQCRGKKVDGRTDLYSLGIILYEMLTRKVPFTGEDSVAVCIKHVTRPLPQFPARLKHMQWILDSLLAKNPDDRFQNGQELARTVAEFIQTGQQSKSQTIKPASEHKPTKSQTQMSQVFALDEEPDEFDELHTERRYTTDLDSEERSFLMPIVLSLLLVVGGVTAYVQRDAWFPKVEEWATGGSKGDESTAQSNQTQQSSQSATDTQIPEQSAKPTPENLLQEADALVQFQPQRLDDMKKALKLVATVKTLEPENSNAQLIYQNILSTSLSEATRLAEEKRFVQAKQWLALVEFEQPDYALLEPARTRVTTLENEFNSHRKSRVEQDQQIAQLIEQGETAVKENRLSSPVGNNAVEYFDQVLTLDPDNQQALAGRQKVVAAYERLVEQAIAENKYSKAKTFLARFNALSDDQAKKNYLRQKITTNEKAYTVEARRQRQQDLLAQQKQKAEQDRRERLSDPMIQMRLLGSLDSARSLEEAGVLVMPPEENALAKYRTALAIDDRNQDAAAGIQRIEVKILSELDLAIEEGNLEASESWLTQLTLFQEDHERLEAYNQAVIDLRAQSQALIEQAANGESSEVDQAMQAAIDEELAEQQMLNQSDEGSDADLQDDAQSQNQEQQQTNTQDTSGSGESGTNEASTSISGTSETDTSETGTQDNSSDTQKSQPQQEDSDSDTQKIAPPKKDNEDDNLNSHAK